MAKRAEKVDPGAAKGPLDRWLGPLYSRHTTLKKFFTTWPFVGLIVVGLVVSFILHGTMRNTQAVMWGKNLVDTGWWLLAARLYWEWGVPGVSLTNEDGTPNAWAYVLSGFIALGAAVIWAT